jgi:hypothetical protein
VPELVVECRAGPQGASVPVRFGRPERMRRVVDVLDRWDGEGHRYFRVLGDDGSLYILRQDTVDARWHLHFFRRKDGR